MTKLRQGARSAWSWWQDRGAGLAAEKTAKIGVGLLVSMILSWLAWLACEEIGGGFGLRRVPDPGRLWVAALAVAAMWQLRPRRIVRRLPDSTAGAPAVAYALPRSATLGAVEPDIRTRAATMMIEDLLAARRPRAAADVAADDLLALPRIGAWVSRDAYAPIAETIERACAQADDRPLTAADVAAAAEDVARQAGAAPVFAERRLSAVHEAGHAIALTCEPTRRLALVSVRPHGSSGGRVTIDSSAWAGTSTECFAKLVTALAGRSAEIHVFRASTGGPVDDMREARELASQMWQAGMRLPGASTSPTGPDEILHAAEAAADRLIAEHAAWHAALAEELMTRDALTAEQVEALRVE
jgi:Peptidase family M41